MNYLFPNLWAVTFLKIAIYDFFNGLEKYDIGLNKVTKHYVSSYFLMDRECWIGWVMG